MIDINELRRLAQEATPGPWYATGKLTRYVEARIDGGLIQEVAACGPTKADGGYGPQQEANASLIAAANPAAISELLDRLEAAEKETESLREGLKRMCLDEDAAAKEAKALRAKIAEMEKQEPYSYIYEYADPIDGSPVWRNVPGYWNNQFPKSSKPLYALPGAQPAPSVPDGFALVNAAHFLAVLDREDWRTAKNRAELRAMIAAAAAAAPEAKP